MLHVAVCRERNSIQKNNCRWIAFLLEVSYFLKKSCLAACLLRCSASHVVNVNLFSLQQNMDIYRRSKLSEQELEALELREREVSVELNR